MTCQVRDAKAGLDAETVAGMILARSKGHVKPPLALRKARHMLSNGRVHRKKAWALVAENGDGPEGFLYAEKRPAFGLDAGTQFVEVHFLIGNRSSDCAKALIGELRTRTRCRIMLPAWGFFGRLGAFERLYGRMDGKPIAVLYQL